MKKFAEEVIELANGYPDFGHPIEIAYQISAEYPHLAKTLAQRLKLAEEIPLLAQLVAASAFDAALHDAFGRANDANSYDLLSGKQMNDDLSIYLDAQFKGEFLDKYTLRQPKERLPALPSGGGDRPAHRGRGQNAGGRRLARIAGRAGSRRTA